MAIDSFILLDIQEGRDTDSVQVGWLSEGELMLTVIDWKDGKNKTSIVINYKEFLEGISYLREPDKDVPNPTQ